MSTAFGKIGTDRQLQDSWVRRLIAAIIDSIIIFVIAWIFAFPLRVDGLILQFVFGLFLFLYASFMESIQGATFGKQIMNLKVTTTDGKMPTYTLALIRNVSKIHPVLWLLDVIIGMATVGDPHQKYTDRIAGTTVVSTIAGGMIVPAPPSPPAPPPPSTDV